MRVDEITSPLLIALGDMSRKADFIYRFKNVNNHCSRFSFLIG